MSPFLAIDAGNSAVKVAVWNGTGWSETLRFPHAPMPPRVWGDRLRPLVGRGTPAGIASVVPAQTDLIASGVELVTGTRPAHVSARLPLPFAMGYATPETLGADRIAAATAAWHLGGGRPVVAVDAGTAVTLDAVDVRDGAPVYRGGAIAPGPDLLVASLARGTNALPHVPFGGPTQAVGDSTAEAIRTGVAGLLAGGVARLLAETSAELSALPLVVATGGVAAWLVACGLPVDAIVPNLVLDGIRLLCALDASTGAAEPFRRG